MSGLSDLLLDYEGLAVCGGFALTLVGLELRYMRGRRRTGFGVALFGALIGLGTLALALLRLHS